MQAGQPFGQFLVGDGQRRHEAQHVRARLQQQQAAGRGMVECLNALGVTHVTLGNHEDDIATPELSARLRELACPCLGTNVRGFHPELPVHDVIDVGDVKVGLVGVGSRSA